jgi:hypothetical protein
MASQPKGDDQMQLVTAANGHLMLTCDGGWCSQLRLWALLRFKHGFRREGRAVVGGGEAIARDFVRGDVRLLASVEAGIGVTLLSESEASDAFLKRFASGV